FGHGFGGAVVGALIGGVAGAMLKFGNRNAPPATAPNVEARLAALEARIAGVEKALHRLVGEAPVPDARGGQDPVSAPASAARAIAAPLVPAAPTTATPPPMPAYGARATPGAKAPAPPAPPPRARDASRPLAARTAS